MSEDKEPSIENAKLAYTIIQSLLDANEVLSDLLIAMSHAMEEDVIKAMIKTNEWESYIESKRTLEITRKQVELFVEELESLDKD